MEVVEKLKGRREFQDELLSNILENIEDSYRYNNMSFNPDLISFKLLFIILKKITEPKLPKNHLNEIFLKKIDKLNKEEIELIDNIKNNYNDYIMIGTLAEIKRNFAYKGTNSINNKIKDSIDNLRMFFFDGSLLFEQCFWIDNILFIKNSSIQSHIKQAEKILKNYDLQKIFNFKGNNKNSLIFYFILNDLKKQSIRYDQKNFKIPLNKIKIWFKSKSNDYKLSHLKNSILKILDQLDSNTQICFDDECLIINF